MKNRRNTRGILHLRQGNIAQGKTDLKFEYVLQSYCFCIQGDFFTGTPTKFAGTGNPPSVGIVSWSSDCHPPTLEKLCVPWWHT